MSLTLDIGGIGTRGDGIAERGGTRYFVPFTLPAETVTANPGGKRGEGVACDLVEVLSPSRDREIPPCVHFGTCGACALQHWRLDAYGAWKTGLVAQALATRGVPAPAFEPIFAALPGERRRADFVLRRHGRRVVAGFHRRASQNVFDLQECHVVMPALAALLPSLRASLATILADGSGLDAVVNDTDTGLDLLLRPHRRLDLALDGRQRLVALAAEAGLARLSWGNRDNAEPIVSARVPRLVYGDVIVEPPPGTFLQATRRAERAMRDSVKAWLGGSKRIADLFSGIGALTVGGTWRATLYESDRPSLAAAEIAGRKLGSNRLTAIRRDLFRNPLTAFELKSFDAVVLDPPRAGAAAQVAELATSRLERIVYASCDPGTFARDARVLQDGGYRLEKLMPIDQFLWSAHVELIALFTK